MQYGKYTVTGEDQSGNPFALDTAISRDPILD
jgi:hypothetical protein